MSTEKFNEEKFNKLLEFVVTISKEDNSLLEMKFYAFHARELLKSLGLYE